MPRCVVSWPGTFFGGVGGVMKGDPGAGQMQPLSGLLGSLYAQTSGAETRLFPPGVLEQAAVF